MNRPQNAYDRALSQLEEDVVKMGNLVNERITRAMEALERQDPLLAKEVVEGDGTIDDLSYAIEEKALELISLQQPMDKDLRILATVMRVSRELERIADYAVNIAEAALRLVDEGPYFKPLVDISRMGDMAKSMLLKSLEAFVTRRMDRAKEVVEADDDVDQLFADLYAELVGYMKKDARYVDQASYLALVARYLERVADHAVNIAEMVVFRETGIRRPGGRDQKSAGLVF